MLKKINRKKALTNFPIFPLRHYDFEKDEEVYACPKVYSNYVLTLPSNTYKSHVNLLVTELINLTKYFKSYTLTFLGDDDTSWLKRLNTYNNFQESLMYLSNNKIGKKFNGALQVELTELPIYIKHLAWLIQTNGILPYIHFIDKEQQFIGNICKYGNLHISLINKKADKALKEFVSLSKFEFMGDVNCYWKFTKSNKIRNRTPTYKTLIK